MASEVESAAMPQNVEGRGINSPLLSVVGEKEMDENASQASWSNWKASWWKNMNNEDASWAKQSWEASSWKKKGDAGPPPIFSGLLEAGKLESYLLRATLWLSTTRLEGCSRGARLLQALEGAAWEACKHLVKNEEFMKDEDNGQKLLTILQGEDMYGLPHTQKLLYDFKKLLSVVKRKKSERNQEFMPRWRDAKEQVEAHGVKLPTELMGFLLVIAYALSASDQQRLMIHTQGKIGETNIITGLRQMEASLDLGNRDSGTAQGLYHNELVDPVSAPADDSTDEEYQTFAKEDDESICLKLALEELSDVEAEDGAIAESECKDILQASVKKSKRTFAETLKGKTWKKKTRGFSGGYKKSVDDHRARDTKQSIEKLKQNTLCGYCRMKGHWHRECPKNPKNLHGEKNIDMMVLCEPHQKRMDPMLGHTVVTFDQMCACYRLKERGLNEAQLVDHWHNLKVVPFVEATYVDDSVRTSMPWPTDSNDTVGVAPCPTTSVPSRWNPWEPRTLKLSPNS